jgi:sRNA-binding regulator protein Hfq
MTPTNFNSETRRPRIAKKPEAPKGHEAFLKSLETNNAVMKVELAHGDILEGTIKHSDKYTISLRVDEGKGGQQVYVLFKHSIVRFWTNPNMQKTEPTATA